MLTMRLADVAPIRPESAVNPTVIVIVVCLALVIGVGSLLVLRNRRQGDE